MSKKKPHDLGEEQQEVVQEPVEQEQSTSYMGNIFKAKSFLP